MPDTTPTAADLRAMAGCATSTLSAAALRAGADAMDERDRLREKVDELECTLDDEEASGSESVAIINKLRADRAALAAALRRCSEVLTVPAAEYVPAISDAWAVIDAALDEHGSGAE